MQRPCGRHAKGFRSTRGSCFDARVEARALLICALLCSADVEVAGAQAEPGSLGRLFGGSAARAPAGRRYSTEIAARLDMLARRADAGPARTAIAHGRRALQRVRAAVARGDERGAERALQIAWAALSLATHRLAAAQAAQARAGAERRAVEAERERTRAREMLVEAQRKLAAARAETP